MKKGVLILYITLLLSCTNSQKWENLSSSGPSKRSESCSFVDEQNNFYIIGGRDITNNRNYKDIWSYNIDSDNWEDISSNQTVYNENFDQGGRFNYCSYDSNENTLYFFGAEKGGQAIPSNVIAWDIYSDDWKKLNIDQPPSLKGHSTLFLDEISFFGEKVLVIFGGLDPANNYSSDIIIFSINRGTFRTLEIEGDIPKARIYHSAIIDNNHKMYIFGGKGKDQVFNDIWCFDFSTLTWSVVDSGDNLIKFEKSYLRTTIFDKNNNSVIFFGGLDHNQDIISSFIKYNIDNGSWKEYSTSNGPENVVKSSGALTKNSNLLIFGGIFETTTSTEHSNQLWEYRF